MVMKVGIPAVVGATGGTAVGFIFGGPAGAAAGGQFGASIGLTIGTWIWGASTVEGMAKQVLGTALSIAEVGAKHLLAGGLMTFAYWGTSKTAQENCATNSQHQMCHIYPYVNGVLLLFSATAIAFTIGKVILGTTSSSKPVIPQKEPSCSFSIPFCSTSSYKNPSSCVLNILSTQSESKC